MALTSAAYAAPGSPPPDGSDDGFGIADSGRSYVRSKSYVSSNIFPGLLVEQRPATRCTPTDAFDAKPSPRSICFAPLPTRPERPQRSGADNRTITKLPF